MTVPTAGLLLKVIIPMLEVEKTKRWFDRTFVDSLRIEMVVMHETSSAKSQFTLSMNALSIVTRDPDNNDVLIHCIPEGIFQSQYRLHTV